MFRLAVYQIIKKEHDQMMISQEKVSKIYKVIQTTKSKVTHRPPTAFSEKKVQKE